jgi:non-homologous end joining protein Ku
MTAEFDPGKYHDTYTEDVKKLIEDKAKGQKRQAPPTTTKRLYGFIAGPYEAGDFTFVNLAAWLRANVAL